MSAAHHSKPHRSAAHIAQCISALSILLALPVMLTACDLENASTEITSSAPAQTTSPPPVTTQSTTTAATLPEPIEPDDVIPPAVQSPRIEGDRLSYTIDNVYSAGEYYTVEISCIKLDPDSDVPALETTTINGSLYGDFRLDLISGTEQLDTLKINIPRSDRFLIFENVLQDLTYGVELISNMRDFDAAEYPDIIQLDFHMINEVEVPQYARYFSISSGKLCEIPVYENGVETAPYGTHLEPQSAGFMLQHIVAKEYGSYTVKQYEYTFDPDSMTFTRKRVRYTGY